MPSCKMRTSGGHLKWHAKYAIMVTGGRKEGKNEGKPETVRMTYFFSMSTGFWKKASFSLKELVMGLLRPMLYAYCLCWIQPIFFENCFAWKYCIALIAEHLSWYWLLRMRWASSIDCDGLLPQVKTRKQFNAKRVNCQILLRCHFSDA